MVLRAGGAVKKGAEYRSKKKNAPGLGRTGRNQVRFGIGGEKAVLERMEPGRGEAASGHYLRHGVPMLDKASARTINKNA